VFGEDLRLLVADEVDVGVDELLQMGPLTPLRQSSTRRWTWPRVWQLPPMLVEWT